MEQSHPNSGALFTLCNPLLDISVPASQELLERLHPLFFHLINTDNFLSQKQY
jgi:hypothetical protein